MAVGMVNAPSPVLGVRLAPLLMGTGLQCVAVRVTLTLLVRAVVLDLGSSGAGSDVRAFVMGAVDGAPYSHPCFCALAEKAEPVTVAAFGDDARCIAPSQSPIVSCPVTQELRHEDRVVAFGVVDANCVLVPDTQLSPRFSAVTLCNLISDAAVIPC